MLSLLAGMVVLLAGSAQIVQANTAAAGSGMNHATSKASGKMPSPQQMLAMKRALPAKRAAAAKKAAAQGLKVSTSTAAVKIKGNKLAVSSETRAATGFAAAGGGTASHRLRKSAGHGAAALERSAALGMPDYYGSTPNYANSPLPLVDPTTGAVSGGIRKFVDTLPGLGAANANDLGQYIPVAVPDTTTYPGSDYYVIELGQYSERMHKDLLPTMLRGYRQLNGPNGTAEQFHYLGPIIIAQKDRPVRVKFINSLPIGAAGNLFLPVDTSIMGAGMGPNGGSEMYTQNRATLHLHGGNTPWISDGTEHQWITPAGETTSYPKGVSVKNVPDMGNTCDAAGSGCQTFYYTNQQSARLLFYHDHAYGITRLNVYAGEAAGYLVQDPVEQGLVSNGTIPSDQIPLIIQDKTFVPDAAQLAAEDPTWDSANWGGAGNLWLPHVYMPNQNPDDPSGANPMGRWDYGPWFWPPFTGQTFGPLPNPLFDPVNAPWESSQNPGTQNPSIVPEAFMDTPVVNGTAYPVLNVDPKAYRFRILNAANDRYWNLSLWQAASQGAMWNADGSLADGLAGEVKTVPFNSSQDAITPFPTSWYDPTVTNRFDDRVGGVPDPSTAGPQMFQVGNEAGMLPGTAPIENRPINYVMNKRDITVGNVAQKALFLGPAERADVVVDFSQFAGKTLILYNDSPAPVPAADPRLDYFTGDSDQTATGGAPTTLPGYGPNTRTIMMIHVAAADPVNPPVAFDQGKLDTALPTAYAASQRKPLVPEPAYNTAFGATFPNALVRIQDTSISFANGLYGLTSLNLTAGGTGYTSAPTVSFTGGGGSGATATAALGTGKISAINVVNGGSGYLNPPSLSVNGGGGSGATASAVLAAAGSVKGVTVTAQGSSYTSAPTVVFTGGGGSGATATATVSNRRIVSVTVTNGGSGYTTNPTVSFTGGGGSGAAATATVGRAIASVNVTNGGSGYTSAPTVSFSGGGGSGATATATISRPVASVTLTSAGSGFTSAPTVSFTNGGGTGATATASIAVALGLEPKSIIEDFDPDYGRMNAMLGVEIPKTTATVQTSIPYLDVDPPTEVIKSSLQSQPLGVLADGTQIWKITHNGVDTHAMHWHMFDVQVINRVGWDGAIRPPDPNELGWKDTVRMNPLEDIIVALRPIIPDVPFDLPNSIRPLDVTAPIGAPLKWVPGVNVDPTNQPVTINNQLVNFGWEYVWHCHLLGHEENIMMRPVVIAVAPKPASGLTAVLVSGKPKLTWVDNSANETGFVVQRATSVNGPWTTLTTTAANATTYTDGTVAKKTAYVYRVVATNVVGLTQTFTAPAVGFPHPQMDAAPSNTVPITSG
jgi:FtsP/CotA-like multicopper oxidase with cupredoxin domain